MSLYDKGSEYSTHSCSGQSRQKVGNENNILEHKRKLTPEAVRSEVAFIASTGKSPSRVSAHSIAPTRGYTPAAVVD
jgi:hypothetical protein